MEQAICFLFGAGDYGTSLPLLPEKGDYVIAVDGGLDYLLQTGISPNLLIGDFDSVTSVKYNKPSTNINTSTNTDTLKNVPYEIISYPPEKDYTDMNLGVREGIKRGYNTFVIYGGLGGRIDHSLANIQLLACLSGQGMRCCLIGNGQVITAITNTSFSVTKDTAHENRINTLFSPVKDRYISIFSHGNTSEGVTIKGLRYETDNVTLTNTFSLGTSNNYMCSDFLISVNKGTLIIVSELE